jgi:hypothetical protein
VVCHHPVPENRDIKVLKWVGLCNKNLRWPRQITAKSLANDVVES